jgi:hypothetical protein
MAIRVCSSAALADEADRGERVFGERIQPLLAQFCYDCHGGGTRKGHLALDEYKSYADLLADRAVWDKVRLQVDCHVMPPARKPQPSLEQRGELLQWIDQSVFYCDPGRPDPGHTVLRRLNRAEYDNTIRDIFFVTSHPAGQFPPDDTGYGFDNVGNVLSLSPMLLEKYLRAAKQVSREAMQLTPPARVSVRKKADELLAIRGTTDGVQGLRVLGDAEAEIGLDIAAPQDGIYRLLLNAAATPAGKSATRAQVLLNGKPLREIDIAAPWSGKRGGLKQITMLMPIPRGEHRMTLRLARPLAGDDPAVVEPRAIAIDRIAFDGPHGPVRPLPSPFLQWLLPGRAIGIPILSLSGEDLAEGSGKSSLDTGASYLATEGFRRTTLVLSDAGRYRFRIKAGAQQAGDEPVRMEVRLGEKVLGAFPITTKAQAPQWIEFDAQLPAGEHDVQIWFVNAFRDEKSGAERWLWLHEFKVEGPTERGSGLARGELPELLSKVGRRLDRRPLTSDEQAKLIALADAAQQAGEPPLGALRLCIEAMLVSPKFLFLGAALPGGPAENGSMPIDEFSLASRLSYFLWSSAPDEELLRLAERGDLRRDLDAQVRRMLADARARALTDNFAGQWLQLRDMSSVAPDRELFPEFTPYLAADMRRESESLFEYILRENRPVLDFLAADYSFVNERLANFYGLPEVKGEAWRRVSLANTPRRGILTHASVLTLTSHPTRSSPVKRGKFVLEKMLGTPPPPQPEDVPPLKEQAEEKGMSLRRQLEAHRSNAACASCHAFLDPIGFGLENFDAIGRWRDRDGQEPIDSSGKLVTGQSFVGYAELNEILRRDRKDAFVKCLAENLLTYALGRGLEYTDKLAVREVCRSTAENGHGFQQMILAVCRSVPFQRMRVPDARPAAPLPPARDGGATP